MMTESIKDEEYDDDGDGASTLGKPGSMCNPDIHIKWITDESETLADVAGRLRLYADYVLELEASGWQLSQPVDNSHGFVEWCGVGEPPGAACALLGCSEHSVTDEAKVD